MIGDVNPMSIGCEFGYYEEPQGFQTESPWKRGIQMSDQTPSGVLLRVCERTQLFPSMSSWSVGM